MDVHGEAIYGTRPFKIFGEGAVDTIGSANFNEGKARPFQPTDIRLTQKGEVLYAFMLGWPTSGSVVIESLKRNNALLPKPIGSVEMLGLSGQLLFEQSDRGLLVRLPQRPSERLDAFAFRLQMA